MTPPLVSVLTTVFNRAEYLAECVESILNLSFQNWELIIVDDCSTDNSLEIAHEYERRDTRIKVFLNKENLGDYTNRNKAASYATGKYLKYLDADDVIYPFSLDIMVKAMEDNPEAAVAVTYNKIDDIKPYPQLVYPEQAYKLYFLEGGIFGTGPSGSLIKRDVFNMLNGFNNIRHEGDIDLWLRIASQYPVLKVQPALLWWRRHPDQEFNKRKNINLGYYTSMKALLNTSCPLNNTDLNAAIKKIKKRSVRNILHMAFKKFEFRLAWSEIKKSQHKLTDILKSL